MKQPIFVLCGLFLAFSAQAIEFEAPSNGPTALIKVSYVAMDSVKIYFTMDGRYRVVVSYDPAAKEGKSHYLNYVGIYSDGFPISESDFKKLTLFAASRSEACPLTIQIDKNSGEILKVSSPCDPRAEAKPENDFG